MENNKSEDNQSLRKFVTAGALFLDQHGQLLIVNPTYKPLWNIPGGYVEANESPRQGCRREVKEELGLDTSLDRLLCVEYSVGTGGRADKVVFIFYGGVLSDEEIARIRLPADELSEHKFLPIEAALSLLPPDKAARTRRSLGQVDQNGALYWDQAMPKQRRRKKAEPAIYAVVEQILFRRPNNRLNRGFLITDPIETSHDGTRDIEESLAELYGIEVSAATISTITDLAAGGRVAKPALGPTIRSSIWMPSISSSGEKGRSKNTAVYILGG